ncbi:MAG: sulfotransferase domain-containing protein [Desulfovibrio sp.]|nr:sulfotransferase domain-containing protein [Desulfovibrio sp.]
MKRVFGRWFRRSLKGPTLLHLHIPRTGGSSVRAFLGSLFPPQAVRSQDFHSSKESLEELRANARAIRLVSGHFHYGLHECFEDSLYVVVLRQPVARVVSLYNYIRQTPGHRLHGFFNEPGMTLKTFYDRHLELSPQFQDGHVRQLLRLDQNPHYRPLDQEDLEAALAHLTSPKTLVVPLERLDLLPRLLERHFGPLGTISMPRINATRPVAADPETVELIRRHNALDQLLYDAVAAGETFSQAATG